MSKRPYGSPKNSSKRQRKSYPSQPTAAVPGEMKYFDCELQGAALSACTTTWVAGTMKDPTTTINLGAAAVATPLCLCAPTVGAALNQRIGRKIFVKKIKVNGTIAVAVQATQAAADNSFKARIVLVQDKQTNATQMTAAQLFNDAGQASTTINSFQNPNNFGRFRVLKDKMITVSNLNMTGSAAANDVVQAGYVYNFKISFVFPQPVECHFNATNGGTVADIVDNSFHLICGVDSVAYAPTMSYYSRVSYKE